MSDSGTISTTIEVPAVRLILAGDIADSRMLLRSMLDCVTGVEVVGEAPDERQAVDAARATGADAVFLCLAAPVMDGRRAATASPADHPDVKIINCSGGDRASTGAAGVAAGADEYLAKAFTVEQLLAQLRDVFPGRALAEKPRTDGRPPPQLGQLPGQATGRDGEPVRVQRYRAMLDALMEGVLITDPSGVVTDANVVAAQVLQLPVSWLVGRSLGEIGLDGDIEDRDIDGGVSGAARSGRPVSGLDFRFHRPDGSSRRLILSVRPLHPPGPGGDALVCFVDLTAQRDSDWAVADRALADEQLAAAARRLRAAVEALTEGFFLTRGRRDQDGRIVDLEFVIANRAGCAMIHRAEADLVGHGYHEAWPLTTSTELFDHYRAVIYTGVPFTTTLTGDSAVGVTGTFEVAVTQLNGGCAFVVTDITARLRTERELAAAHAAVQERAEKLERSNRDLRAYASAISHDLREPLRTVTGFVDVLRIRYTADLPAEARELLDHVNSVTQRMDQRITAILDYARAGAATAPPHPVDTAQVAAAAARDVSKVLDEAGARLRIGELPTVECDDVQLQRVFQNLLTNAAVYHHRTVTPRIEVSARHLDRHWEFTVADNGPGVQGGARDSIFGMFQRGPDADSYRGHGMGLALCRRIIESYGGHIWVQDNPGGGSRFCFTLPTPAQSSPATDAGAPDPPGRSLKDGCPPH